MLTKKITYTDFDGNKRTETFYFNLSRSEITTLQLTYPGGYAEYIEKTVDSNDRPKIMRMFEDIIKRSYGEKSEDGKRLIKSEELSTAFMQTGAYDELFMELCTNADASLNFISGVLPDFGDQVDKDQIIKNAFDKVDKKNENSKSTETELGNA